MAALSAAVARSVRSSSLSARRCWAARARFRAARSGPLSTTLMERDGEADDRRRGGPTSRASLWARCRRRAYLIYRRRRLLSFLEASTELRFFRVDRPRLPPRLRRRPRRARLRAAAIRCRGLGQWRARYERPGPCAPSPPGRDGPGLAPDSLPPGGPPTPGPRAPALVAGLVEACLDRSVRSSGCRISRHRRPTGGRVPGCVADTAKGRETFTAAAAWSWPAAASNGTTS